MAIRQIFNRVPVAGVALALSLATASGAWAACSDPADRRVA